MDIRWIAAPFLSLVIFIAVRRWWGRIWLALKTSTRWLVAFLSDSTTCEVAKTCCGEVAVLLLVFPTVDTIYDHRKLSDPILHASIEAGLVFFLFAIILAHAEKRNKED